MTPPDDDRAWLDGVRRKVVALSWLALGLNIGNVGLAIFERRWLNAATSAVVCAVVTLSLLVFYKLRHGLKPVTALVPLSSEEVEHFRVAEGDLICGDEQRFPADLRRLLAIVRKRAPEQCPPWPHGDDDEIDDAEPTR